MGLDRDVDLLRRDGFTQRGDQSEIAGKSAGDEHLAARGNADVGSESTVDIASREDLVGADRSAAVATGVTPAARHDRRDHDLAAEPRAFIGAGIDDDSADLVTEDEGKSVPRRHAFVIEAQVGVADAAAGDRHDGVAGKGRFVPLVEDHRLPGGSHGPSTNAHDREPPLRSMSTRSVRRGVGKWGSADCFAPLNRRIGKAKQAGIE